MARRANGSGNYLQVAQVRVTAPPFTFACWFNCAASSINRLIAIATAGSGDQQHVLIASLLAGNIQALSRTTSNGAATSTAGPTANTWHHAAGVWTSSVSRAAFLDGANKGTDTTSIAPAGMDLTQIGISGNAGALSGAVAEAAIWDRALTDGEILTLAGGASPEANSADLIHYWPLCGFLAPEPDYAGVDNLSITGALTRSRHPSQARTLRCQWPLDAHLTRQGQGGIPIGIG